MRFFFGLLIAVMGTQPVLAQSWYDALLSDLEACRFSAWQLCPDGLTCLPMRSAARDACRAACEHDLDTQRDIWGLAKDLRADELACVDGQHGYQDPGLECIDRGAWRRSEISARADAYDFTANDYAYLVKLSGREIVDSVYRVAARGFVADGSCAIDYNQPRSVTLLLTVALALNRVRAVGPGFVHWQDAQALSLEDLRRRRGY